MFLDATQSAPKDQIRNQTCKCKLNLNLPKVPEVMTMGIILPTGIFSKTSEIEIVYPLVN
jgi:hypothetical protein